MLPTTPPLPSPWPQVAGLQLTYDTVEDLRERMRDVAPHLTRVGELEAANFFALTSKLLKVTQQGCMCAWMVCTV